MQTIQSSGRTLKASCITVCLCVQTWEAAWLTISARKEKLVSWNILCRYNKLSQSTTLSVPIVHEDHPELPLCIWNMLYECLPLIVVHGLLQIGKWLSQSTILSSLQIMHSCHQRLKHAAWVSAFKVSLQERMKGRIRSLACRARQLSWGFCESAETVASTIQSDTCACKPSRALAGRWKQAA